MLEPRPQSFVAECFWPAPGSILIRVDEAALCRFEGDPQAVRRTADLAATPFERIVETAQPPWPPDTSEGENN